MLQTSIVRNLETGSDRRRHSQDRVRARRREWGEAFDLFCAQAYEYAVEISKELYGLITEIGAAMNLEPSQRAYVAELVV